MSQSKRGSISEAIANIIPGYWINYFANIALLPLFCGTIVTQYNNHDSTGLFFTFSYVGISYTFVSIARQYLLRRAFNKLGPKADFYTMLIMLKNRIKGVKNG